MVSTLFVKAEIEPTLHCSNNTVDNSFDPESFWNCASERSNNQSRLWIPITCKQALLYDPHTIRRQHTEELNSKGFHNIIPLWNDSSLMKISQCLGEPLLKNYACSLKKKTFIFFWQAINSLRCFRPSVREMYPFFRGYSFCKTRLPNLILAYRAFVLLFKNVITTQRYRTNCRKWTLKHSFGHQ